MKTKILFNKFKKYIRTATLLLLFLMPMRMLAPELDKELKKKTIENAIDDYTIIKNLSLLKDSSLRSRKETFELVQPVIEIYLKRGGYKDYFPRMDSLSHAIACIFVSESSNYLGQPARSSLWINHNNPFGITSSVGKTYKSWEMIKGKRVIVNRTFCTYNSFSDAMDSLMWNCLLRESYLETTNSESVYDFLHNLYKNKYMTNKHWPEFAYQHIYLVAMKENKNDKINKI